MPRAISVILATVILLAVGFYMGARPVKALRIAMTDLGEEYKARRIELERQAELAEARVRLWQARSEILLAAMDADEENYDLAGERVAQARDLITRAVAVPGMLLDAAPVQSMLETALPAITGSDPEVSGLLRGAAEELGRILERQHA